MRTVEELEQDYRDAIAVVNATYYAAYATKGAGAAAYADAARATRAACDAADAAHKLWQDALKKELEDGRDTP